MTATRQPKTATKTVAKVEPNHTVPTVYSMARAAEILGLSERSVRRYTYDGLIPCRRAGSRILYTASDLNRYLDSIADGGIISVA